MDPEEYLSTFNFGEDFAQYEFIFYKIHFELGVIRLSQMLGFILPAVMNDSFPLMFSSYIITRIVLSKLLVKRKDKKMFCLKEKGRKKVATSLLKLFCPIEERNVNGSCNNEFKEECKDAVVQKEANTRIQILEEDVCAVCLDDISDEDTEVLECKHEFHRSCIVECMKHKPSCPMCRSPVLVCCRYGAERDQTPSFYLISLIGFQLVYSRLQLLALYLGYTGYSEWVHTNLLTILYCISLFGFIVNKC